MLRAKFYVADVLQRVDKDGNVSGQIVKLQAAYDPNPDSPNYQFWKATPSGLLDMTINNPEGFGVFVAGKGFYLDFTPVEKEA
jgi:hypothetical protein